MKLQVGECYRLRNGEIVGPLIARDYASAYKFGDHRKSNAYSWDEDGRWEDCSRINARDIVAHILKEKEMNEKAIHLSNVMSVNGVWCINIAEAERISKELQRIKAENEIKAGDYFINKQQGHISKCIYTERDRVYYKEAPIKEWYWTDNCVKIIDPTRSLNEIYEGMK